MKKLSIIIAVNILENLEETLISIKSQSCINELEILITLNDLALEDELLKILSNYKLDAKIAKIDNKHLHFARTYQIPDCTTQYVVFLDAGNTISNNFCENIIENFETFNTDILLFKTNVYNELFTPIVHDQNFNIMKDEYVQFDPTIINKVYKVDVFNDKDIFFNNWKFSEFAVIPSLAKNVSNIMFVPNINYTVHIQNQINESEEEYNPELFNIFFASKKLYSRLEKSDLLCGLEFLYINLFLHKLSRIFLKFDKIKETKLCAIELEDTFINWRNNKYFKKKDFKYKFFAIVAYYKLRFIMRYLVKRENKIKE